MPQLECIDSRTTKTLLLKEIRDVFFSCLRGFGFAIAVSIYIKIHGTYILLKSESALTFNA
jgi:hypothetical protein